MRVQEHLEKVQDYLNEKERAPVETVELLQTIAERMESIDDSLAVLVDWTETLEKRLLDKARAG